jgi:hypothetical protein
MPRETEPLIAALERIRAVRGEARERRPWRRWPW